MKDQLFWSFNDAMLNSIARQIRIGFEIQLRQDAGTVGTDGFDAEGELIGNVRNRVSSSDQTKHLVLTIRQEIVSRLLAVAVLIKMCRKESSSVGRDVFPPLPDCLNGMNQFLRSGFLRQVPSAPGA